MNWTQATSRGGDQLALRRHNLGLLLRHLRDHGPRSRAQLAAQTGLNKATVSSLVNELLERALLRVGVAERGAVGRPGRVLELDGGSVCGLGVAIDVDRLSVVALDLRGDVVDRKTVWTDVPALSPAEVVDRTAALVGEVLVSLEARGAASVGTCVGVAGLVRSSDGTVVTAPNLGWREIPLAALLGERLGGAAQPLRVDNEGNLAVLAEAAVRGPECEDLVVLTGGVGLGSGVLAGAQALRGKEGFAGEAGHIKVDPNGILCGCGRTGCWETKVGLAAMLGAAADPDDPVHDPALDLETRMAEIDRRASLGDARTLSALHEVGTWLGAGSAALVDVLNPGVIVLSGYFAPLARWLLQPMREELAAGAIAPEAGGCTVEISELGVDAVVRGGALSALELVFADPTAVARTSALTVSEPIGGIT